MSPLRSTQAAEEEPLKKARGGTPLKVIAPTSWIVLAVGLIITVVATLSMESVLDRVAKLDFDVQCNEIRSIIKNRIDDHARILMSGAGFFDADEGVTREEWRIFTQRQKVEKQLPGIQGIGFSLLIPRAELPRHIQEIRSQGFPEYNVRPGGDRETYSSIIYLEPFSGRNLRAFGYDMFSEPVRRKAMEQARDTDAATLSGKVVLVQETDEEVQAGTLMYVPVYRKGMHIETVEQRRAAIYGWVYSPYRMTDLMRGILGGHNLGKSEYLHLQVFDGAPSRENLLYGNISAGNGSPRFSRQIPMDFNGHRWTLRFSQMGGGFMAVEYIPVWLSLTGGSIIAFLLFFLVRALQNTRNEAMRIADELTIELRESEVKHRLLIENSHDIIYMLNAEGVFTFVSPAWTALLGHPLTEVVGQSFKRFVHAEDIPACLVWLKKVIEMGQRQEGIEYRVRHADGAWYWHTSSAVPLRDETGSVVGFEGTARDITERKKAEEALRQAGERLTLAVRAGGVGIWDYDVVNNTLIWDDQMYRLYGITAKTFGGAYEAWQAGVHPEDRRSGDEELQRALRGEKEFDTEFRVLWPDGTVRNIRALAVTKRDADGKPLRMIGTNWDITVQKQAEEAVTILAAAKTKFTSTVSHELRSPLAAIKAATDIVLDGLAGPVNPGQKDALDIAKENIGRLGRLINDVLVYQKIDAGRMSYHFTENDLGEVVREAVRNAGLFAKNRTADLVVKFGEDLPRIKFDRDRIFQVFTNLVTNAVKYTESGSIIISARREDHELHVSVQDFGPGVKAEYLESIFEPFSQAADNQKGGTGLGLAISREIVFAHRGRIWVESEAGKGSTFHFTLPI